MHQNEINALASQHGLDIDQQKCYSDKRWHFGLAKDYPDGTYAQALVSYCYGQVGDVRAFVGIYGERIIADDGDKTYPSMEVAVADIAKRFATLRGNPRASRATEQTQLECEAP